VAIPDFQTLMRPLLQLHDDGTEKTQGELRSALADQFRLSEEELTERIPSGTARTFANRVAWASTHMKQAGLVEKPRRGVSRITARGSAVLRESPDRIDMAVLERFPEYVEFRSRKSGRQRTGVLTGAVQADAPPGTPEETIDLAHQEVHAAIVEELLGRILDRDDRFFEEVVLDVLVALGYGGSRREAAARVGRSGDGGIDGVIQEDRLGLDAIYVQAKRWARDRAVGPREIREFMGALQDADAAKGVFITTSTFTSEASGLARRRRIVLIDGETLTGLMVDAEVGVTTVKTYELKRIDEDYFADDT
jgi:restriction system protein